MLKTLLFLGSLIISVLSQNNLRFFEFNSPETLSLEQLQEDINERKQILTDFILNEISPTFNTVPIYIANNENFNFNSVVQPILNNLDSEVDPDFLLLTLVRILFMTEDFNEEILDAITRIKLWITPGEQLRIYWTENHQIQYSAAAYLLRQKFGEESFPQDFFDEHLDTRLEWFLRTKQETGFFEFSSPIYYQFTTAALLLLHDFAEDPVVREGAFQCLLTGVREWMPITSSEGIVTHSAARAFQFFYFRDDNMFGNGAQQVISFLTGLGPLIDTSSSIRAVTTALILSDINLTTAISTYSPNTFEIRQVGLAESERDAIFQQLPDFERHLAQITMGLFGDPTHINDLFDFLDFFQLFNREDFGPLSLLQNVRTPQARIEFATLTESIGTGSSYYVPEFVAYKDSNVVLTSCNDYTPGFKGYQQFPSMAAIGSATVFTYSMSEDLFFDSRNGRTQLLGNNQIPFLKQKQNVLLAVYNPRRDLPAFDLDLEVLFYFDASLFDEVVDEGNWVFGSLNSAFVGVYREQCVTSIEDHVLTRCDDQIQTWITVVGTQQSHQTFANFRTSLLTSDITIERSANCGKTEASIDGQVFDELFCQGDVDILGSDDEDGSGDSGNNGGNSGNEEGNGGFDNILFSQIMVGGGFIALSTFVVVYYAYIKPMKQNKNVVSNAPESNDEVNAQVPEDNIEDLEETGDDQVRLPSGRIVDI